MTYRLAMSGAEYVAPVIFGLFTLGWIGLLVLALMTPQEPQLWVAVAFSALILSSWWWFFLSIPYRIDFNGPDDIHFVALRRTLRMAATDIQSLKSQGSMYVLRYDGGKVSLLIQFTGFYELLTAIKAANPAFETRGI